jgi:transcriptional regulator
MHPNPLYRATDRDTNLAFARTRGFGTLAVTAPDGPVLSHIPFLISPDGGSLDLHLVRSNPIARMAGDGLDAVIAVQGGDAYVSPDWYGVADQVPTWNYVAVHLRGRLSPLPHEAMRDMLERQSAAYEGRLPKTPWTTDKMTPEVLDRMMRQILPFRMSIEDVQGTWKLGQNKSAEAREGAASGIEAAPMGQDGAGIAALMRNARST